MTDTKQCQSCGHVCPYPIGATKADLHIPDISLRDWFAGQALAAMHLQTSDGESSYADSVAERRSVDAYRYADAMLARGAKP